MLPHLFLSTLPARGATAVDVGGKGKRALFLSTLPARGATRTDVVNRGIKLVNFYPRSPRGERLFQFVQLGGGVVFLSTLPARGATPSLHKTVDVAGFLSTLPARGATTSRLSPPRNASYFYPRSPRGERRPQVQHGVADGDISIHAPREGSDALAADKIILAPISIHAPGEGSDPGLSGGQCRHEYISIHAPREGSDLTRRIEAQVRLQFLSTLPARGATCLPRLSQLNARFLSTLPARGATVVVLVTPFALVFLSTLPARGATPWCKRPPALHQISIHAPREGSDIRYPQTGTARFYFYPRSPRGERRHSPAVGYIFAPISIHAPREGSDSTRQH